MDTQNTLVSIPTDLLHEILSRLPIKMVGRCRCVSKIMASKLGSEDFKQFFLTRSVTRPRLLMAVRLFCPLPRNNQDYAFYSMPQPQNSYDEKSRLVVRPDFHMKFPCLSRKYFMYASGLFYFSDRCISVEEYKTSRVICNPNTGQYVILPKLRTDKEPPSFLGFDPIDKQFKLLLINARVNKKRINFILTLESGKMTWRTIKCPLLSTFRLAFRRSGICINGVLYYLSQDIGTKSYVIVCFDVRTETFKFKPIVIDDLQHIISRRLINYKGKLSIIILREKIPDHRVELSMLVVEDDEDVEKQEWSKYTLPRRDFGSYIYAVGMTSTDDIVLSTTSNRLFYVYYFNPGRNSLQNVEVESFEYVGHGTVHVFMDHVEDLYVNDVKHLKSNVYADLREARLIKFESTNAFEALYLSDEEDDDDQA